MRQCPSCGSDLTLKSKPRSPEQLRRYFAMVRAAHFHWPDSLEKQFANPEELRTWLQLKAGWREMVARIPLFGMKKEQAEFIVTAAFTAAKSKAMPTLYNDELIIWKAKSIAFDKMEHHEFCKLSDAVASVIEQETGLRVDDLMKHGEAA